MFCSIVTKGRDAPNLVIVSHYPFFSRNTSWDVNDYMVSLREEGMNWRQIYWRQSATSSLVQIDERGVSSLLGFGLSSIISTAFAAARRFPAATTHAVLTIQRNPFSTTSVIPQLATTRAAAGKRFDLTRGKTKRSEDECMKISFSRHLLYPPIVDEGLRVSRSRRHVVVVVVVVVVVSFFVV